MKFSTTLTTCMFTLIAVAGCDPEVDATDRDLQAQHDQLADHADERMAAARADAAGPMSLDPELALADAPDVARIACISGSVEYGYLPSGVCGGCKINGVYPGQKILYRKRDCVAGAWTAWTPNGSECQDC